MNTTTLRRIAGRTVLVLAAAATALIASTATAQAASAAKVTFTTNASGSYQMLTYSTGGDHANLQVNRLGNTVIFKDMNGARITSGTDKCFENLLAGQVQCSATDLDTIKMIGSDGPDQFKNYSGIPSHQLGLGGEDALIGGAGVPDRIEGGPGNDDIRTQDSGPALYAHDQIDCGVGAEDESFNDSADTVTNCEIVSTFNL